MGILVGKGSAHSRVVTDLGYVVSCRYMNPYEKQKQREHRIAGAITLVFFSPIIIFVLGVLLTS